MKNLSPLLPTTDINELFILFPDPIERLLLSGEAKTVFEAEEKYLDAAYPETLALLASTRADEELAEHPLFKLYRSYGSPAREDALQ